MSRAEVTLAEEELAEVNDLLAESAPMEMIRWAVERYQSRLTMATVFGLEGCVLIHLWRRSSLEFTFSTWTLDTSLPKPWPCATRLPIGTASRSTLVRPDTSVQEYEALHGGPLYIANSEKCCYDSTLSRCGGRWSGLTHGSRPSGWTSRRIEPERRSWSGIPSSAS